MIKKTYILIFTLLFLFSNKSVFGACDIPEYNINACKNSSCNEMKVTKITSSSSFLSYLDKISYETIKYDDYLKDGLNKIKSDYGMRTFKNSDDDIIRLSKLLDTNDGIKYFLENISNNQFEGIYIPMSSIFINYISNNGYKFKIKNVCKDSICYETEINEFNSNSSDKKILLGTKKSIDFDDFDILSIDENSTLSISKSTMLAGNGVDVTFNFNDILPIGSTNCTTNKYKYTIYVKDVDGNTVTSSTINDDFTINPSNLAVFDSERDLNDVIQAENSVGENNRVYFTITESMSISKAGKYYFYVQIEDFSGKTTDLIKINFGALEVYSNINKISSGTIQIEENNKYSGETFRFFLRLYDVYNNIIDNKSIEVSYIGESNSGELFYFSDVNDYKPGPLPFIVESPNFKMIFNNIGFHTNKFKISYDEIDDNRNSTGNTGSFDILSDEKISVKPLTTSDIPISCSNNDITLAVICTSDDLSGCNNTYTKDGFGNIINKSITFTSESDNGKEGFLTIIDNAYNITKFAYVFDHFDSTEPQIDIFRGTSPFVNNSKSIVNSDILNINFNEPTAPKCISEVTYEIEIKENNIWITLRDGIFYNKLSELPIANFFKYSGEKILRITATDKYLNEAIINFSHTLFPDYIDLNINNTSVVLDSSTPNGESYGNNSDEYKYTITLKDQYGNPIHDKEIYSFDTISCSDTTGCKNKINTQINSGSDAIIESSNKWITDSEGKVYFKLQSLAPGIFNERFVFDTYEWNSNYIDYGNKKEYLVGSNSNSNTFKIPIIGRLNIDGTDNPALNTNYKFNISLTNIGKLNNILEGKLFLNKDSVVNKTDGHKWEDNSFKIIGNNNFSLSDMDLSFSGTVDSTINYSSAISIGFKDLKIIYKIGGKLVSYFLENSELEGGCNVETLGLKVYGALEGEGKASEVGQNSNFSDLSKGYLKGKIRKNAFILSKNRISNKEKKINGIIYIEGNIYYSEIKNNLGSNDTIIVKNGNFIIDENIDTNIGIIVLQGNYNVLSDFNKSGNVYVNKDVTKINAIIYSDGTFRSANRNGDIYSDSELNKKLEFNGSLFSRNTIGGSVGQNTLPGGKVITLSSDYYLANIYDLNNVRKQILGCSGNNDDNYSFIIRYNSEIQINPPKGFLLK